MFWKYWHCIHQWLGISIANPTDVLEHTVQFLDTIVFRNDIWLALQATWLATIWIIWKEHNNCFGRSTTIVFEDAVQFLDSIDFRNEIWLGLQVAWLATIWKELDEQNRKCTVLPK